MTLQMLLALLLFLHISQAQLLVSHDPGSPAALCIQDFIRKHFSLASKVVLQENHFDVSRTPVKMDFPFIINAPEIPLIRGLEHRTFADVVVVTETSFNVTRLLNTTLWNRHTWFLFAAEYFTTIRTTFLAFWRYNVRNVVAFLPNNTKVLIYTFQPHTEVGCEDTNPMEIGLCVNWNLNTSDMKQDKNMHRCPVNVTVVNLPPTVMFPNAASVNGSPSITGIEGKILMEVARRLNFSARFSVARDGEKWGWIEPSPHGVVGEVYVGYSNIGFGLLASTLERFEYLDMILGYNRIECVTWSVPHGAAWRLPRWVGILLKEFTLHMWYLLLFTFCVAVLAFWFATRVTFTESLLHNGVDALTYVFSSALAVPVRIPHSSPLRLLFLSWVLYSFVITTAYQSSMGSKLTVPPLDKDINSFRDLLDSHLHFTGFYNTFRLILYGNPSGELKEITERLEATTYDVSEVLNRIVNNRNIAYLRESTTFVYSAISNPEARGNVHRMRDCAYNYSPAIVLTKKWSFTPAVQRVVSSLFEAGIINWWRSVYIYNIPVQPPPVQALSLSHMIGPFIVLCLGSTVALVIFLVEILHYRILTRTKSFKQ